MWAPGADLGFLEWLGCKIPMCAKRAWKNFDHAYLIKTTPILIILSYHWTVPSRHFNKCKTSGCTTAYLEGGFTTCLEHDHYYHQTLSYVNQCICMAKHINSTVFYTVTLTIWGGCNPLNPPPSKSAHGHVLAHTNISKFNLRNKAIIATFADKKITQWSGPPSLTMINTGFSVECPSLLKYAQWQLSQCYGV